ncbi:TPA: filamentous hemagglutinin N-terminal domain-containing protein, partial [Escherichia coli]|nr:filamentous hemagglutinin N-terminal domain-containing protein [Escherichia coli]
MNRIYKLKFDKRRNELVVVSEITAGVGKAKATGRVEGVKASRRGVRAMALSLLSGMIMMANPVTAANLPTGGQIVAGSGSIQTPSGNQMNIHQNSQNMVANWNSFDIGKGNTVQFYQPNSSAVALNRVVGGGESKIMGNLKANGQVFLVNPNGVLFGKDASVSTSGFVASTRDIKNDDFMNRRYTFSGGQKAGAEIVNQGALTTNAGGYIVLAADKVSNSGTIRTPGGKTVLAAGERVTLQLDNGGLTSVQVSGDVVNALVENRGLISARDGQVYLTAHGRDMLMNTVLNVSGVVEAGGMHRQDGNIVLDGGDSGVVHLSGTLQADNASGQGGKVVVQGQNILLDKGSSITATGGQGGGEVYIGGGWQGKDSSIRNADKVVMKDGARIDVSATQQGNGGTAVLWSESFTNFRGQISAKGGENGGNGGQVETSSHGNLQAFGSVSASAKKGKAGNWLLDPLDITIVNGSSSSVTESSDASGFEVSPSASGSQVSNTSIINELNNGTSVTVLTSSTTAGGNQNGNITVDADINKTNGADATLTLKADGNINVNNSITSTQGKLNVNLAAANTSRTGTITLGNNVSITTNGGNITAGTANASNSVTINVTGTNTVLNTTGTSNGNQAGNITLNGSRVEVKNANITAGNFTLNATANGADLNNVTLMAAHDINLTGNSTNGTGLQLNGTNTLNATNGSISLTGNSTNGTGLFLGGNKTLSASNGSINLTGSSTSGVGLYLGENNSTNTLTATNGNISLNGVSVANVAIEIRGTNTLTADNINLTGNSKNGMGIDVQRGANTLNATNGSINLTGNSTNGTGLQLINGTNTLNATNGSICLTGNSINGTGLQLNGTNTLNATNGSISLTGNSTNGNGTGLFLGGNKTLSASNGSINLTGSSTSGVGLYLGERNSTNAFTATNGSINLNGVSVAKSAIEIRGNNTLTADNINLTGNSTKSFGIDAQDGANTLNATNGSINLTGNSTNGTGLQLINGTNTLNAAGDVNINGTGHLSSGAGPGVGFIYIQNATITSSTGNITIDGNVSNIESAVFLRDVTLNASKGDISIRGTSDYAAKHTHVFQGGTVWLYNTNMTAQNIDINATNTNATVGNSYLYGDALFLAGNLTFTGNTTINATANRGAAILFGATTSFGPSILNMTFSNGSVVMNATNNGTSEISGNITEYKSAIATDMWGAPGNTVFNYPLHVNISLSNSNLTICASSEDADGIHGSNINSFWNITGTGNASITGMSQHGNGVSLEDININASGLNGTTTLTGIATGNGNGVDISGNTTLINVVVNGNGTDGSGVNISGNLTSSGNSTVTGNASGNGNGVNISGNITDGVISGGATGNGSG